MLIFFKSYLGFCFLGNPVNSSYPFRFFLFGLSCSTFSFIVMTIDCLYFGMQRKSFFKLVYIKGNRLSLIFTWALCAGGVGFLGSLLDVIQITIHASLAIAVSWTYILPRIILHSNEEEPIQQPGGEEI